MKNSRYLILVFCGLLLFSIKETLEKEIARKDIPAEAKKRAQTLINSLDEEGNNVILLAKMKK